MQMRAPFGEIGNARRQPVRMQAQAQHVHRRFEQRRRAHQRATAPTDALAATMVQCRSIASAGYGCVPLQHQVDRLRARRSGSDRRACARANTGAKPAATSSTLRSRSGMSSRLGQAQHHVARRLRAPGLEEAQMARGNFGVRRDIELAHAAALTPFAQQSANGRNGTDHAGKIARKERASITWEVIAARQRASYVGTWTALVPSGQPNGA